MSLRSSSSLRLLRSRRAALAATTTSASSSSSTSDGRRSRRARTLRYASVKASTRTTEHHPRATGKWKEGGEAARGFAAAAATTTTTDAKRNRQFSVASSSSSFRSVSSRGNGDDGSTTNEEEEEEKISLGEGGERGEKEERTFENATNGTNSINNNGKNNSIVNIPNALSVGRALSGPIIAHMIVQGPEAYSTELVLASIAAAGVSDYLDGYLARRWDQTSNFGSFFDAAADKIFVSSVGVGMAASGQLPAWMIGLFVFRDCGFLASGFWRRANALKFENVTWRQYFAIDAVRREDERENRLAKVDEERRSSNMSSSSSSSSSSGSSSSNSSSGGGGISGEGGAVQKRRSDWEAFNSTEKWEPLYVGKVATALQMGLLAVACGQTLDHIPLLFETHEAQKHAISSLTENFGYFTFAATSYATAQYTKAYFSHPGWKERRAERRDARREHLRASVRDIRDSAKTKYDSFKRTSAEKISEEYRSRRRQKRREHEEAATLRVERVE
jgi:phosphatidylglycerophosphate synthase